MTSSANSANSIRSQISSSLPTVFPVDVADVIIQYWHEPSRPTPLLSSDTRILYQLPQGKPDPNALCSPDTLRNDTRARVLHAPTKDRTCWYFALNSIRPRIGKQPTDALQSLRRIEKTCSARRKAVTKHHASLPGFFVVGMSDELRKLCNGWTRQYVATYVIPFWNRFEPVFIEFDRVIGTGPRPPMLPVFLEYIVQTKFDDLIQFREDKKFARRSAINTAFLKVLNKEPAILFDEFQENVSAADLHSPWARLGPRKWTDLTQIEQFQLLDYFAFRVSAEAYQLEKSQWNPHRPIEILIAELKERGPLVVGGKFGENAYQDGALINTNVTIAGRDIYGFRVGTHLKERCTFLHTITIIGAEVAETKGDPYYRGYVYYVDPDDGSDPKDLSKQRIFKISYQSLVDNVNDLCGERTQHESENGYAWAAKSLAVGQTYSLE